MLLQIYNQVQSESLMTVPAPIIGLVSNRSWDLPPCIESELGHGDRSRPNGDENALSD